MGPNRSCSACLFSQLSLSVILSIPRIKRRRRAFTLADGVFRVINSFVARTPDEADRYFGAEAVEILRKA